MDIFQPVLVIPTPIQPVGSPAQTTVPSPVTEFPGRGHRTRAPAAKYKDYIGYQTVCLKDTTLVQHCASSLSSETVSGKILYPLIEYVTDVHFSPSHRVYLAGIEPKSYYEAVKHKVWRQAVRGEVDALEEQGTWDVIDLPPGKVAIACLCVFKVKYNADGTVERHKARLVVCGN